MAKCISKELLFLAFGWIFIFGFPGKSCAATTANISVKSTEGLAPFTVLFDGSASGGEIVYYSWDFGDGTTDTGFLVGKRFDASGSHTVTLTVYDTHNESSSTTIVINALERPITANTYYVANASNGGDDANDGLCPTDQGNCGPWRTVQHVLDEADNIPDGSVILFNRGDSFKYSGEIDVKRWSLNPLMRPSPYYITFGAFGTGERPIIYRDTADGAAIFKTAGTDLGIIFEDLHFMRNNQIEGVSDGMTMWFYASGYPGHQVIFRRSLVENGLSGVLITRGNGCTFEDSEFRNSAGGLGGGVSQSNVYYRNCLIHNVTDTHLIYFAGHDAPVSNYLIEDCTFYDNANNHGGITMHGHKSNGRFRRNEFYNVGVPISLSSGYSPPNGGGEYLSHFVIEQNYIHDSINYPLRFSSAQNITIKNNIFSENSWGAGLVRLDPKSDDSDMNNENIRFYNNLFHGHNSDNPGRVFRWWTTAEVDTLEVKNNIFLSPGDDVEILFTNDDVTGTVVFENNLYYLPNNGRNMFITGTGSYALSSWQMLGFDSGSFEGRDPLLTGPNYDLPGGSPAIDSGLSLLPVHKDYGGNKRPSGSAWDIGPHEYSSPALETTPFLP